MRKRHLFGGIPKARFLMNRRLKFERSNGRRKRVRGELILGKQGFSLQKLTRSGGNVGEQPFRAVSAISSFFVCFSRPSANEVKREVARCTRPPRAAGARPLYPATGYRLLNYKILRARVVHHDSARTLLRFELERLRKLHADILLRLQQHEQLNLVLKIRTRRISE